MELYIILIVIALIGAPLVLSIVALVISSNTRRDLRKLRESQAPAKDAQAAVQPVQTPAPKPGKTPPAPPASPEARPRVVKKDKKPKDRSGLELVLGGRVASFVGIAVLLIGIAFLVGYAIRNAWLGPGARVLLGLVAGGGLVVLGHICEVRGMDKLRILAQALTGGGAALFYFTVFAAYGIYELIPALLCGAGLLVSALAVMALALVYSSQAVALIGVLGAFITPLLIGGEFDRGIFPLVYISVLNLPVMILGLRRSWQSLYNIAFGLTVAFVLIWIDWFRAENWIEGIVFTSIYFLEFAALGLLKLRCERRTAGRGIDLVRLCLNSLLYLLALYWLFEKSDYNSWTATAFLLVAGVHILIARAGWRWLPAFTRDILAFLIGGLTFASLALPIQLDGAWVSCGWAIEGVLLCWFAIRVGSRQLRAAALLLGLVGLFKTLVIDIDLYAIEPDLFLNARFGSGMLTALLLGVQAWLLARRGTTSGRLDSAWMSALVWMAIFGILAVFFADTFWSLGGDEAWAWTLSSTALLLLAIFTSMLAAGSGIFKWPAAVLLLLFPLKILLDLLMITSLDWWDAGDHFLNLVFSVQIVAAAVFLVFLARGPLENVYSGGRRGATLSVANEMLAIAAAIAVISSELLRADTDWSSTAITICWAAAAIVLVILGLWRGRRRYRYAGLALFSAALVKIFLFDLSQLRDLERIVAFIVAGVLLLLLSYLYQRMADKFLAMEDDQDE